MEKLTLQVDGMSCEHCKNAVTKAVSALPGVSSVNVDLKAKTVTVQHDPALATLEKIKAEIEELDYEVVG
ncbi:MAG: copper ion binding protein [Treponema sp.]|jgi:copper chaperone|nr:copper ion binding protein [Treponema sp.]